MPDEVAVATSRIMGEWTTPQIHRRLDQEMVLSRRPHLQVGVAGARKPAHLRRGRGRECKKQRGKEGGGLDTAMAVTTAFDGKISLNNNSVR